MPGVMADSPITPSAPASVKVLCKWGGNLVWQHDGEGSPRYSGGHARLLTLSSHTPLSLGQLQHHLQGLMLDGDEGSHAIAGRELAAAPHVVCKYQVHDAGPDELVSHAGRVKGYRRAGSAGWRQRRRQSTEGPQDERRRIGPGIRQQR